MPEESLENHFKLENINNPRDYVQKLINIELNRKLADSFSISSTNDSKLYGMNYLTVFKNYERSSPLNSISFQIHLSETIEKMGRIKASKELAQTRGFFLNIERLLTMFYIFHWAGYIFDDNRIIQVTYAAYSQILNIFQSYMNYFFPWSLTRPNYIYRPELDFSPEILQKKLKTLRKLYKRMVDSIESNKNIIKLEESKIPSENEMKKLNITGPFARAIGILPHETRSTSRTTHSSTKYLQFAFNNEPNLMSIVRTSYSEIYLSLNRSMKLIPSLMTKENYVTEVNISGEENSTMTYPLGQAHLTLNLTDNKLNYFNFVPVQKNNLYGFKKLVSHFNHPLSSLIKLFYFPEFLVFSKKGVL
ncbi:MAG: hypothetical protein ACTSW1_16770 [Candidatus Hodarchaeales archaeon]